MSSTSSLTFPVTVIHTDKRTYQAGEVFHPGHAEAWGDHIVLGFSRPDKYGDIYAKIARPYCYASCIGTTSPGVLTGVEEYAMNFTQLQRETVKVGHPMVSGSVEPLERGYDDEVIDLRTEAT